MKKTVLCGRSEAGKMCVARNVKRMRDIIACGVLWSLCTGLSIGTARAQDVPVTEVVTNGTVITFNVKGGDTLQYDELLTDSTTALHKYGYGTLVITNNNQSYTGPTTIHAGILKMCHQCALGLPEGGSDQAATGHPITVEDGAQLYTEQPCVNQSFRHIPRRAVLSGSGPDGTGALVCNGISSASWANNDSWMYYIELAADATVRTVKFRYGLNNTDLKGHTLMIDGDGTIAFTGLQNKSAGTLHLKRWTTVQNPMTCAGGADGRFLVDGNQLNFWSGDHQLVWTTVFTNNASASANGTWTSGGRNTLQGPVVFAGPTAFYQQNATADHSFKITGPISGPGKMTVSGTRLEVVLNNTANTFTGQVAIASGVLRAETPQTLPDYDQTSKVTLSSGSATLRLPVGEGGWDAASYNAAVSAVTYASDGGGRVLAWTDAGVTTEWDAATAFSGPFLAHSGAGSLSFAGTVPNDASTKIQNWGGTLTLTGNRTRYMKNLRAIAGTLILDDAGTLYSWDMNENAAGAWHRVGGLGSSTIDGLVLTAPTRLVMKSGSTIIGPMAYSGKVGVSLFIGERGKQGAIFEIQKGAVFTNKVTVGYDVSEKGAVHQFGGEVYNTTDGGHDTYLGRAQDSYGYYGLYGGHYALRNWFGLGHDIASTGVFEQRGGVCEFASMCVGRGGWSSFLMAGGEVRGSVLTVGNQFYGHPGGGGMATFTMAGGDAYMTLSGSLALNERTNDFTSVANLNAGVIETPKIEWSTRYLTNRKDKNNTHTYLNFNGGTWKATQDTTAPFGVGDSLVERVTVFPGGIGVDTAGKNVTLNSGLQRPEGRGVASITLPSDMDKTGYVGSPDVRITGGGGTGATAFALYNPQTLSVTGVVVTCAGWGYTSAPTVMIPSGDRTTNTTFTAVLTAADQTAGGITKKGAGTLTLACTNQLDGTTVVQAGTLAVADAEALPLAADLTLGAGAVLDNTCGTLLTFTPATLTGLGGELKGANLTVGSTWMLPADDLATNAVMTLNGALSFADGAVVSVSGEASLATKTHVLVRTTGGITGMPDLDLTTLNNDKYWQLARDGNNLALIYAAGTLIMLR